MPGLQDDGSKILVYTFRKSGTYESLENFLVADARNSKGIQIIFLHEFIKNLST
jgi:hypothetical protein